MVWRGFWWEHVLPFGEEGRNSWLVRPGRVTQISLWLLEYSAVETKYYCEMVMLSVETASIPGEMWKTSILNFFFFLKER